MSKFSHWFKPPLVSGIIGGILLGALLLSFSGTVVAQTISDECSECHHDKVQEWKVSGHPYKLTKGEVAQNRPIPLPEGYEWDEISYVIGGYKWKSRYMDENGYIITQGRGDTPGNTQYNNLTGEWSNYHADEANGTKPYDCGSCHTTGWVDNPDPSNLEGNQDGLAGIHGTFQAGGVQCIQCHGGAMHADFGSVDSSAAACGACHIRGESNTIPAGGGFIRHHEQYNEHLAGAHGSADCVACHDPHKKGEWSIKEDAQCGVSCHADKMESFAKTSMYDYCVECKDCHMPYATKSAQALGPHEGDLQTHIFYIDTYPMADMFSEDGLFVNLDGDGKAKVTMDFACQACHETAELDELALFAEDFHDVDKGLEDIGVNSGLTGTWWDESRSGEGYLLEIGYFGDTQIMFGSFYTYDSTGNQVWLTLETVSIDGMTVNLNIYMPDGAQWGADFNSGDVNRVLWGTGTFTFPTCGSADVVLTPNQAMKDMGFTDQAYPITRTLESGNTCPTFINNEMKAAMMVK